MAGIAEKFIPFTFTNLANGKAEINIRGTIGVPKAYAEFVSSGAGGTVTDFEKALKNLGDVDEVTLRVFSRGGDIFTAMAMHDMIAAHPARFVALVDGLAASAATWLMNACDEIQMPANAWYFMHNVQSVALGDHRTLRKAAEESEKFTGDLARLYQGRMKQAGKKTSLNKVREMMDTETWLNGSEALDQGLVDKVIGEVALSNSLEGIASLPGDFTPANLERVPAALRALFDTPATPNPGKEKHNTATDMKPEEVQTLITNAIKAHADEAAKQITALRDGIKTDLANAIKPEIEGAIKPLNERLGDMDKKLANVDSLAERFTKIEEQHKAGISGGGIGGGQPASNVQTPGENPAPANEAELEAALAKCKTHPEKMNLINAFKKARAA